MGSSAGCRVCGERGPGRRFTCAACLSVCYCSKQHQRLDWPTHKPACAPYKVVKREDVGRGLVSTRAIRRGEVVLREGPLVRGPGCGSGPVCLGCYNSLKGDLSLTCPECGWPFCSVACSKSPDHIPECHWANSKRNAKVKITQWVTPHPTYGCILALRILFLKEWKPSWWERLMSLESHAQERMGSEKYQSDRFAVASLLRRFYHLDKDFTEEQILHVCGIIQVNSHEVPLSEPGHEAIYWQGSLVEHSCLPNLSKSFSPKGEVILRATRDVPQGESLSISYTDPLWSTPARRSHLARTKYFQCHCDRCSDVTELGTYLSSVSCVDSDCKGAMVPDTFLKPVAGWRCNHCNMEASVDVVNRTLAKWSTQLAQLDKENTQALKNFLEGCIKELPETHSIMVDAGLALVHKLGQPHGLPSLLPQDLALKQLLASKLIQLTSLIAPGECRIRGMLNFELHATLAERARRESANLSPDAVRSLLLESRSCLEETAELLKYEPDSLPEGQIYSQACDNLTDLNALLATSYIDAPF